jgi:phosphoribosylglycinamide formyltransferase-1
VTKKLRVGVLASGNGTDLQSIIDASEDGLIDAGVVVVLSDRKDAFALKRAESNKIKGIFVNPKENDVIDEEIDKILTQNNVDLVVGAGYMRILSGDFVKKWYGKLINIHPTLLPCFKGTNGQGDALNYGIKITGCTTHFIDDKIDHGPIILQAALKVLPDDSRDSLAKRILEVEHQVLPRTIQLYAEGRLKIEGRKVKILPGDSWLKKQEKNSEVLYSEGY